MKRLFCAGLLFGLVLFGLGVWSYHNTREVVDAGFPLAEFRIRVLDEQKSPIGGARLDVHPRGQGYPIEEASPRAGQDGLITCHQSHWGVQYGWESWRLWWLIPVDSGRPQFKCSISANGYMTSTFHFESLYDKPSGWTKRNVSGGVWDIEIYECEVILQRGVPSRFLIGLFPVARRNWPAAAFVH